MVFSTYSYSSGAGIYAFPLCGNLNDFNGIFLRTGDGKRAGEGEDKGKTIREMHSKKEIERSIPEMTEPEAAGWEDYPREGDVELITGIGLPAVLDRVPDPMKYGTDPG